jgi:acetyltransferase
LAQRAALAHTGSLTGPDDAYDALFRQLGIVRVYDLDELIETAELLSAARTLPAGSPAIVSISGGSCGIIADLAESLDLTLRPFTRRQRSASVRSCRRSLPMPWNGRCC